MPNWAWGQMNERRIQCRRLEGARRDWGPTKEQPQRDACHLVPCWCEWMLFEVLFLLSLFWGGKEWKQVSALQVTCDRLFESVTVSVFEKATSTSSKCDAGCSRRVVSRVSKVVIYKMPCLIHRRSKMSEWKSQHRGGWVLFGRAREKQIRNGIHEVNYSNPFLSRYSSNQEIFTYVKVPISNIGSDNLPHPRR